MAFLARSVVAEEALKDKLSSLAKTGGFVIGLLIGQHTKDRDYIIHLAPSPTPDVGDLGSEEEEGGNGGGGGGGGGKAPDSMAKVVEATVAQHARQVIRMLPGGLDVVGIFVSTPQADFSTSSSQAKVRAVLTGVWRTSSRIHLDTATTTTEKLVVHVCNKTLKVTAKMVDVNPTAPLVQNNADLKFGACSWQQLQYRYNVWLSVWLPSHAAPQPLYRTVLAQIKSWAEGVVDSLVLINGQLRQDFDFLDPQAEEKSPRKKGGVRGLQDLSPPRTYKAEILESGCGARSPNSDPEASGSVRVSGTVAGLAFVHTKATVGEARAAVLGDLVRSVASRWEMHCDSLVEEPPQNLPGAIIHEPPRRVFLEGGGLAVSLCDYLFPGDGVGDAVISAGELLGLTVRDDNVDDTVETLPDASDVIAEEEGSSAPLERTADMGGVTCPLTHLLLAGGVAVVGVGVSYMMLTSQS